MENLNGITKTVDTTKIPVFSAIDYEYKQIGETVTKDTLPLEYSYFGSADLRKTAFHAQY